MRSFSYMSAVFATAFALAAASPQQASSSVSSPSSSRANSEATKVAATSININLKKATQTLSNPKLQLGRVTSSKASQSSSSAASTSTSKRNPLVLPKPSSSSTKQSSSRASSTQASSTKASSSAAASATQSSSSKYSLRGDALPSFYFGANSYYLYALPDADRIAVLDAMKGAGMSVVRIFITHIYENNKGSGNDEIPDLEQWGLGQYDDTILKKIDKLMAECYARNLKLIIACGDRYALGFWDTDQYAYAYNIVSGGSGAQKISDASTFYTSDSAMTYFDRRIDHILSHKNSYMDNLPWSQLDSVIYALEPQNEPQGHMDLASSSWTCDRSGRIKENLPANSNILVTSGGGITIATSLADWAFNCKNIDIISVHDYGTSASSTVSALISGKKKAADYGKSILFEEWGALGGNKANILQSFAYGLRDAGIPWLYWEVVKPGKASSDFEVWTDEDSWYQAIGNGDVTGAINWGSRGSSSRAKRHASVAEIAGTPAAMPKLGRRMVSQDQVNRHATVAKRRQNKRRSAVSGESSDRELTLL